MGSSAVWVAHIVPPSGRSPLRPFLVGLALEHALFIIR
jgi:hypothetical protein